MENHLDINSQFVPYNLALKLKELGFDENTLAGYTLWQNPTLQEPTLLLHIPTGKYSKWSPIPDYGKYSHRTFDMIKAPLWQQAFDWFREKGYIIQLNIFDSYDRGDGYEEEGYYFKISDYDGWRGGLRNTYKGESYGKIEQAKAACLAKLIELCKNN